MNDELPTRNRIVDETHEPKDKISNDILTSFFSDSLSNNTSDDILNTIKNQISVCKMTSTLSIILVYINGYTFRVRFFDYLTNEPEFQIDVIFTNLDDLLIDKIETKDKQLLMIELKKRIEYNKKVESGEIKLPPPPPPSGE